MPDAHEKPGRQLDELGTVIGDCTDRYIQRIAELESKLAAAEKQIQIDHIHALNAINLQREELRDKLAMAALSRIGKVRRAQWVAVQAYEIADAMLDIRKTPLPRQADDNGGPKS